MITFSKFYPAAVCSGSSVSTLLTIEYRLSLYIKLYSDRWLYQWQVNHAYLLEIEIKPSVCVCIRLLINDRSISFDSPPKNVLTHPISHSLQTNRQTTFTRCHADRFKQLRAKFELNYPFPEQPWTTTNTQYTKTIKTDPSGQLIVWDNQTTWCMEWKLLLPHRIVVGITHSLTKTSIILCVYERWEKIKVMRKPNSYYTSN